MPNLTRFSPRLAAGLSAAALVSVLAGAAARQQPRMSPGAKPPVPSPSEPRVRQPIVPPAAKSVTPPPPPSPAPPQPVGDQVTLDLNQGRVDEKTGISTATDFKYTEKDTVITGDKARYDRRNEILDTENNLVLDDPKHHVTGDKAHIERRKRLAIITSNVIIVLKPEEDTTLPPASNSGGEKGNLAPATISGGDTSTPTTPLPPTPDRDRQNAQNQKKHGGTITCDRVEDFYRRKFSILSGHLVFKQHFTNDKGEIVERTMTSEHAEYDGKKDLLHLFGPVDYQDSEKQEFHTKEDVIVGTKEGQETIENKGRTIYILPKIPDDGGDETPPAKPGKTK